MAHPVPNRPKLKAEKPSAAPRTGRISPFKPPAKNKKPDPSRRAESEKILFFIVLIVEKKRDFGSNHYTIVKFRPIRD